MDVVGQYTQEFNNLTGQCLPCGDIYQSSGLHKHIKKHHPNEMWVLQEIPNVILNPDYVGVHPKEADSVELVKTIGDNVMVCIKLDKKNGYLFVASAFTINNSKLTNRLKSGRLKKR